MDKLRAIKFFCRAVETNSFTSAAHALDVPPSVMSKTIAALESELQLVLFNRSTRRLALTDAGASYYESCRQIIRDMEEAEARAKHGSAEASGTLRIGLHPVFGFCVYSRIGEFLSAHPGINAELSHTNSPASLLDQGLDVILRVGPLRDSSFVARELGSLDLQVYASPAYLRAHGHPQHPRDLVRHHAIIPGRLDEESFASWTFSNGRKQEVVRVPARLVLHEGVGLGVCAVGGVGIVRMYDLAGHPFTKDGSLEVILRRWSSGLIQFMR
jgi:DNA-binding transcriptional LysR family regulator